MKGKIPLDPPLQRRGKIAKGVVILFLFLMVPVAWSATISTRLDRNPVYLDESFRVIFESDGSIDGFPDFGPLEQNFDIINRSQGSSMQIINGQVSNKTQWTLTLMAKQTGSFVIPAIRFGRDMSEAVNIMVEPARQGQSGDAGDVSLEVTAEPKSAYVQSQIIYTVRLFHAVNLVNGSLSDPEFSKGDAIVEKLGDDHEYETLRNGVRYAVIERSYAIFPQQSGSLEIKPIVFEGQIVDRRRSVFDPFATQTSRVKRLQSKPVTLEVMAVPQNVQASHWLPAQELKLDETWPEPLEFKVGEPVTRTITIRAKGLTAAQLPEIKGNIPDGIKLYPDQPALNDDKRTDGIIGTRQEKTAMIPTQQGDFVLPAIEIPWWDTSKNHQEVARIPGRTIHVLAAANQSGATTVPPVARPRQDNPEIPSTDKKSDVRPVSGETIPSVSGLWFWVSVILAVGWLFTIVWILITRKSVRGDASAKKERSESLSRIRQGLKRACTNGIAADTRTLLLEWAKQHWHANPPQNLGEIGKRCGGYLAKEIDLLNQALYSPDAGQWKGGGLWQAFEQYTASGRAGKTPAGEVLAPLYP